MQFHHHGYVSHDPRVRPAAGSGLDRPDELPDRMDVLIVGAGPAGMILAAQLSQFPEVTTRLVERRPGRLQIGQADGIQPRSVETFQAFEFAERITAEAYRITHTNFWAPDPADPEKIVRTSRTEDDPSGISEFPHLIVNQARVLDYFAEYAANGPARIAPDFGYEFVGLSTHRSGAGSDGVERTEGTDGTDGADGTGTAGTPDAAGATDGMDAVDAADPADDSHSAPVPTPDADYPVTVTLRRTAGPDAGSIRQVQAKYVVGCDGARSAVRESIGRHLKGDQAFHAWAVLDALAVTDFPDIRTKCAIQSRHGSILLIPREGGYLFRMYVDLGTVSAQDAGQVRATTVETAVAKANQILSPYRLDVRDVAWYSVYEVGHRLTDKFDDVEVSGPAGDEQREAVFRPSMGPPVSRADMVASRRCDRRIRPAATRFEQPIIPSSRRCRRVSPSSGSAWDRPHTAGRDAGAN